jgi:hypothetical protein
VKTSFAHGNAGFAFDGTVVGEASAMIIGGSLVVTNGALTTVGFTNVLMPYGDCWPNGGTETTGPADRVATIAFDSSTAFTGYATVVYPISAGVTQPGCLQLASHSTHCTSGKGCY